jgi:hypothetical protein
MGIPNTRSDCRLRSTALERTELIVRKSANRFRAFPVHSIRSSGTRRLSPSGRWREMRPALSLFAPFNTIKSVLSIACELQRPRRRVVLVKLEIRIRTPRLHSLWPVASEGYHTESVCTLRFNSEN